MTITITQAQFDADVAAAHISLAGEYPTREAANRALYEALAQQWGVTIKRAPPTKGNDDAR